MTTIISGFSRTALSTDSSQEEDDVNPLQQQICEHAGRVQQLQQRLAVLKTSPYVSDIIDDQNFLLSTESKPLDSLQQTLQQEAALVHFLENHIYTQAKGDYLEAKRLYDEEMDDEKIFEMRALMDSASEGFSIVGYESWKEGVEVTHLYGRVLLDSAKIESSYLKGIHHRVFITYQKVIQIFSDLYRNTLNEHTTLRYQILSLQCEAHEFFGYALLKGGHPLHAAAHFESFLNYHYLVSRHRPDCFHYPIDLSYVYLNLSVACREMGRLVQSHRYDWIANKLCIY